MASDVTTPRSRRALLAAAAGAAGALAAQAALPLAAAAAPVNLQTESNNLTSAETAVTQGTDGQVAFRVANGTSAAAGLVATAGDTSEISVNTSFTGAYGWSEADTAEGFGAGVWGESPDTGVVGSGSTGVYGVGAVGVWGQGYGAPGIIADSFDSAQPAMLARGNTTSAPALQVSGKVRFNRSGISSMSSATSTKTVKLAGVTTSSKVFAVLSTSETGRWVRAVVPASGSFKVYLNTSLSSSAKVAWFVLD